MLRSTVRIVGVLLAVFGFALWRSNEARSLIQPRQLTTHITKSVPQPLHKSVHPAAHEPFTRSSVEVSRDSVQDYFVIHLFKIDGWYDTKIPITADLAVAHSCLNEPATPPPCASGVQVKVGDRVLRQPATNAHQSIFMVYTSPRPNPDGEVVPLPPNAMTTLKLRVDPSHNEDDLVYCVRISPMNSAGTTLTSPALQEQAALQKWGFHLK